MKDDRNSNEVKAVDALIIAALLHDTASDQEIDLAADEAVLTQADRAQLNSMGVDFVQRIVEDGWVGRAIKGNDDPSDGDECVLERVTK